MFLHSPKHRDDERQQCKMGDQAADNKSADELNNLHGSQSLARFDFEAECFEAVILRIVSAVFIIPNLYATH